MVVETACNPFENLRTFWGEEYSPELAERIVAAPAAHLHEFRFFLEENAVPYNYPLPGLAKGNLRPVVTTCAEDLVPGDRATVPFERAMSLLLYAHEVVTDDVSFYLASQRVEERQSTAQWLLAAEPLYEQGLIHFRALWQRKIHPSVSATREEHRAIGGDPEIREALSRYTYLAGRALGSEDRTSVERTLVQWLATDVRANMVFANRWPGAITQLATSPTALLVAKHLLQAVQPQREQNSVKVLTLMQFLVPNLAADAQLLSAVRRDNEVFEEFRSYITRALNSVAITDLDDPAQVQAARRDIYDEFAPLRARLDGTVRQSNVLQTSKRNLRNFSVAAATAATSFLLTSSPTGAALTGGAGLGAGLVYDQVAAYRARKKTEPIADLIAIFGE